MPATASTITLVLGGQRSGKSRYAEKLVRASGLDPVFLATAEPRNEEMAARIAAHQVQRGAAWTTIEEPLALAEAVRAEAAPGRILLVDCLTLWLSNLLEAERDLEAAKDRLCQSLEEARGPVILVSNEVGLATIPMHPLTRRFVDAAGLLNQAIAAVADQVVFMAAGLPLTLKAPCVDEPS